MKIANGFILAMLLVTGLAQAQKGPYTPRPFPPMPAAWPQNFNVANNTPARFNVVVDKPAQVVATVQFTGSPITITLTRPNGQKTVVRANTSPGRLEAPVAASEATPGMTWSLEIATAPAVFSLPRPGMPAPPSPQANPTASGSVSVALNPPVSAPAPPPAPAPKVTPTITGLSKNPVRPREELIITGRGLGGGPNGYGRVVFSSSPSQSTEALEWSDTRVRLVVPPGFHGRDLLQISVQTSWNPTTGPSVQSPPVPIAIQLPPPTFCFGYHTRGDGAWQIACYGGADVCNSNRTSYLVGKPSVEALPCIPEVYCYSFGDRVNNGPFGYKLNACFANAAACESDRKGRVILLGGKDSSCGRFSHAGPPGK